MYKHVFLDFDDTIYDTKGNASEALLELFEAFALSRYFESFESFASDYWKRNVEVWALYSKGLMDKPTLIKERFRYPFQCKGIDVTDEFLLELNDWFLEKTSTKRKLIEGAIELLEYLNSKYEVHMLSNGFEQVQYAKMRNSGVEKYFKEVILSDHIGVNKPDKAIFDYAIEKTGALASESIMIGDNMDTDIIGAKNFGMDQLYFNNNFNLIKICNPTYEVKSLDEIMGIL